jgi:LPS-assembly protein
MPSAAPGTTHLRASRLQSQEDDFTELTGNAAVWRDGQGVRADSLRYQRRTSQADALGGVTITQPSGARFHTNEAHLNLSQRTGFADGGKYNLPGDWGRGDMERVEFLGPNRTRLSDARFTTCPAGQDDWFVHASRIDIDTKEDMATARNVTLDLLGVPIIYLPYLSFPISDQRKTGFLMPGIGYSSRQGTILATPYYLNLGPAYDATLTPRYMSERGTQLQTEFRYLGRDFVGQIDAEYLPEDKATGEDRAAGSVRHRQTFSPYVSGLIELRGVSDKDYVNDFGDNLSVTSETHLPQIAEINYRGPLWTATARAADYQTVDRTIAPGDRPYARLPQLLVNGNVPSDAARGLRYRFDGELVHFERESSVTGQRAHLSPSITFGRSRPWGFINTEIGMHHISYALQETSQEDPSVTAPFASIDAGLYAERPFTVGDSAFTHTIEPRVYYLHVPFRKQDHLPNFDTSAPDFSFANLFRNNRFVGGDRIGDADQLTFALTSRLLNDRDGSEWLRGSIGQIRYFDERRVNVPAGIVEDTTSDLVAEAVAWLPRNWHVRTNVQWSPELHSAARGTFYLQHQPGTDRILNLGYRLIRSELEQTDVSFEWPLGGRWTARGRSLYSVKDNENIESYVGLQYHACCWMVRLYTARQLTQTTEDAAQLTEQRASVRIEFELSGLGRGGTPAESPLKQSLYAFPRPGPSTPAP